MKHYFVDHRASALGKLERTPQGGYRAPGVIARTGIMEYQAGALRRQGVELGPEFADSDMVRIYQGPEVLKAVADAFVPGELPVTREHPPRFVTPQTWRDSTRGNVLSMEFDGTYLRGMFAIQDAELLDDVDKNVRRGVSPGYMAVTEFQKGVTDTGETYHARRVALEYNHAAVVKDPRGGQVVCLALDSDEIPTEEVTVKLKIKGVEYDADKAQAAIDALEAEVIAASTRATKAEDAATAAQAELAEKTSPEAILKYVADAKTAQDAADARATKVTKVKAYFGDSVDAERLEKSNDYLDGLFAGIPADPDGLNKLRPRGAGTDAKDAPKPAPAAPKLSAREKMLEEHRAAGKAPLKG